MPKTCSKCKITYMKPEKHFNKDKSRKDGLTYYCKECNREITQWYEDKKKKPLVEKTCKFSGCNKKFKTRIEKKLFCCMSCRSKDYQERVGLDKVRTKQNFIKKFRRRKEIKPNGQKRWSENDISILFDMRKKEIGFHEIAKKLGRGYDACIFKFHKIKKEENKKFKTYMEY